MTSAIEKLCAERKIKLTENRRIIAKVVSNSDDHPDVEEIYQRASKINPKIGIATVYRTMAMFEELELIAKHDFGGSNKARYEIINHNEHHDHLIDVVSNKVHEFFNQELENLKDKIAKDMGYELIGHRLELYCKPIKRVK